MHKQHTTPNTAAPTATPEAEKHRHPVPAEAQTRLSRLHAGLEELRRKRGLWVAGKDGEPEWLAPDGNVPPGWEPVEPA